MKILWICNVWPEPESSAAGFRTIQLMKSCLSAGFNVTAISPCQANSFQIKLEELGATTRQFEPNNSEIEVFLASLQPDVVFFDRFMIEEQFSFYIKKSCPNAVHILDTIDLHSLRRSRALSLTNKIQISTENNIPLSNPDTLRELASIFRSDLALVVSDYELALLAKSSIGTEKLFLCRFLYGATLSTSSFEARENFVSIGNFNHAPNLDSFNLLRTYLWPKLRAKLNAIGISNAQLHIYGSYSDRHQNALSSPQEGLHVKGQCKNACETLSKYKVNLAPLRFGAGIKGKISDGWHVGTPCVGTSIAAEGMHETLPFGGFVENDWDKFCEKACELYCNRNVWEDKSRHGLLIISKLYNSTEIATQFIQRIKDTVNNLPYIRKRDIFGSVLWHQSNRSTEYMSRWIEAKNKLKHS